LRRAAAEVGPSATGVPGHIRRLTIGDGPSSSRLHAVVRASGLGGIAKLSCLRPCVASACAGRSHEKCSPSKAGASGPFVLVWEATWAPRTIEQPLLLRLWPVRQPPVRRPSRDSNVCICGPSRNGRAGCAPVVDWSEYSLKRVYLTNCTSTMPGLDDHAMSATGSSDRADEFERGDGAELSPLAF
jgi:hypothetical protein